MPAADNVHPYSRGTFSLVSTKLKLELWVKFYKRSAAKPNPFRTSHRVWELKNILRVTRSHILLIPLAAQVTW